MPRLRAAPALLLLLFLTTLLYTAHADLDSASDAAAPRDSDPDLDLDAAGLGDMPVDEGEDDADDDDDDDEDADLDAEDPEPEPPAPDTPAVLDPPGESAASGYVTPPRGAVLFFDDFQDGLSLWTHSKDPAYAGVFATGQGAAPTFPGDRALIIPEKARRYALSATLDGLSDLSSNDLVLQYEVKLDQGMTCGGAYMKLPTAADFDPKTFNGDTAYSIMFGPDKCGTTDKVHFIFQSKNPVTGKMTEHHLKEPPAVANTYDKKTHLYTLVVKKDGSFEVLIDAEVKKQGTLSDSFEPPVQPPKDVPDPEDKKPEDWVDQAKIPDPDATKPDDWDEDAPSEIVDDEAEKPDGWLDNEPEKIPDPAVGKPEEWDDEEDGEWEAPQIPNPKCEEVGCGPWTAPMKPNPEYKGKWSAPLIDNPKYIGVWKPRNIPNKEYYDASKVSLLPVHGLGFEIWTMDQGVLFDNVWLGSDIEAAKKFAEDSYVVKQKTELEREEEENKKAEKEAKDASKKEKESSGKMGEVLAKVEDVIDRLDLALQPLEGWLSDLGADVVFDKLLDIGIQKPMLVVASVPLVIVLFFLIVLSGGKKTVPAPTDSAAQKKKTDEPTPDAPTPTDTVENIDESAASDEQEKTVRKRRPATAE